MAEARRREQRRTHLDASAVPVERALLARAAEVERHFDAQVEAGLPASRLAPELAEQFRALAEELHWW